LDGGMSQGGRICRKVGRGVRGDDEGDTYEIDVTDHEVRIVAHGRVIRTLSGADADAVRAVLDDPAALERLIARNVR
jgi:hypothetical protein